MWHEVTFGRELFEQLAEMDERIADAVATGGCERCGGPLHRSDYQRKPRGGSIATAGEAFTKRASLCCGREGCRKRSLPPSLRFLGGRVYLEMVVLIATVQAMLARTPRAACEITGVPAPRSVLCQSPKAVARAPGLPDETELRRGWRLDDDITPRAAVRVREKARAAPPRRASSPRPASRERARRAPLRLVHVAARFRRDDALLCTR
jgi:hypothetical protein